MFGAHFGISTLAGRRRSASFSPAALSGLIAWYDPSDLTSLFQDAAMSVPVVADGDPVGAVLDKSGNGYHLTQATANGRPTYRSSGGTSWIEGDGVDDQLQGSLSLIGADPDIGIAASIRILSQSQPDHRIFELGSGTGALAGAFGTAGWSWRYNNGNTRFSASVPNMDVFCRWQRASGASYGQSEFYLGETAASVSGESNPAAHPSVSLTDFELFSSSSGGAAGNIRLYGLIVYSSLATGEASQLATYFA